MLNPPSLDEFSALAQAAYADLPEDVLAVMGELEIRVSEWPEQAALDAVGVEHPLGLLGLFEGVGIGRAGVSLYTGAFPNRIWLYRQPILNFAAARTDPLPDIIKHVLVHEIGHHFGLSDDDMDKIDESDS